MKRRYHESGIRHADGLIPMATVQVHGHFGAGGGDSDYHFFPQVTVAVPQMVGCNLSMEICSWRSK